MTSTTLNRTKKSRRIWALVAAGVATVFLAACGPSSSSDTPLPSGTESTDTYTPSYESTDTYTPSYESTDTYTPSYESTDPASYEPPPAATTDPCAFPGDPLCPDTPVTVPPPDLGSW
jgi:hypothetical protein